MSEINNSTTPQKGFIPSLALVGNTLLCGLAVHHYYGRNAAIGCTLTYVALSRLNPHSPDQFWFSLSRKTVKDLRMGVLICLLPLLQLAAGALLKFRGQTVNQLPIQWLIQALKESPKETLRAIFAMSVEAPIVEEIIFRGFVLEKTRDVQCILFGAEPEADRQVTMKTILAAWKRFLDRILPEEKKPENKTDIELELDNTPAITPSLRQWTRILLQAAIFGAAHYHPSQGITNLQILSATAMSGIVMGLLKEVPIGNGESTDCLWRSALMHHAHNTSVVFRVWLLGV